MDNFVVGSYIRLKLKEKGITQEELAEQLGISASAVSQNLAGKSSFDISNLMIIAELIGDSLDNIVRGGERKESELEKSIKDGIDKFINLVKKGYPIKEKDINGKFAIDYSISFDNIDIVKHIIDNNLYHDGVHTQPDYIAYLLKHELSYYLNKQYITNNTLFTSDNNKTLSNIVYPTFFSNQHQIETIISQGESIKNKISQSGLLLIDSILKCKNSEIKSLIPYFHQTSYGNTSNELMVLIAVAIENDDVDSLNKIWDYKSREINNKWMMYAIKRKSINVTSEFMKLDSTNNNAMKLVESDDLEFFKKLYDKTNKNEFFITETLKMAVIKGNKEIVKYIAESCLEKSKNIALEQVKNGDMEMIKTLLDSGAKFSYKNEGEVIPLEAITMVIKSLLEIKHEK